MSIYSLALEAMLFEHLMEEGMLSVHRHIGRVEKSVYLRLFMASLALT